MIYFFAFFVSNSNKCLNLWNVNSSAKVHYYIRKSVDPMKTKQNKTLEKNRNKCSKGTKKTPHRHSLSWIIKSFYFRYCADTHRWSLKAYVQCLFSHQSRKNLLHFIQFQKKNVARFLNSVSIQCAQWDKREKKGNVYIVQQ